MRFELHQVTELGQTDVAISYIKGIANEDNLTQIRDRLKQIKHDGITMTDKALEEWLFKQGFHPLPFVTIYRETRYSCSTFARGPYT